jgi:diaminohydroxyphosphoribosylaminopyrimidine deaminase/5-amino-6-(5-phosphoribosylamino)uracil reductase
MTGKERDVAFMRRALELAERYRGRTSPNPIVGCVIVDARGKVIAEGAHEKLGARHAEVDALAKLGGKAAGATMYVNLEPCTHHGRTPPCTPAVKASGVARVVIGTEDPVPGHGGGIEALRRAGISVSRVLVDECDAANRPFLTWSRAGRPAFTLKAAITLDGKIATVEGQSQWITGELARADVHRLRDTHDAVLVGIGTVLADDPRLTARLSGARELGEKDITSVLVEGGGEVHASFLDARLADEVVLYIAPKAVGGPAPSWIGGKGLGSLQAAYRFEFVGEPVRIGPDLRLRAVRTD